jgi:hypothetical protein
MMLKLRKRRRRKSKWLRNRIGPNRERHAPFEEDLHQLGIHCLANMVAIPPVLCNDEVFLLLPKLADSVLPLP